MLESVTVPRYGRRWITFDVTDAVVEWMNGGDHQESHIDNEVSYEINPDIVHPYPNLGLVVEVEDERESRLDAAEYLSLRNCSGDDRGTMKIMKLQGDPSGRLLPHVDLVLSVSAAGGPLL